MQKIATDIRTSAGETTFDEKLKTIVLLRKTHTLPNTGEIQETPKYISTLFGVVFYDKKYYPTSLTTYGDHTIARQPPCDQQKSDRSEAVLAAETTKRNTDEMRRM